MKGADINPVTKPLSVRALDGDTRARSHSPITQGRHVGDDKLLKDLQSRVTKCVNNFAQRNLVDVVRTSDDALKRELGPEQNVTKVMEKRRHSRIPAHTV